MAKMSLFVVIKINATITTIKYYQIINYMVKFKFIVNLDIMVINLIQ